MNKSSRFFILLSALFLITGSFVVRAADSLTVTFRYDDPTNQFPLAYLPGDFNNWGSNNNGAIAVNSPTKMTYDAANGYWTKSVRLKIGETHYYKIYFNLDSNGTSWQWISDPLNPLTDNSGYGNSMLNVNDPMIVEPLVSTGAGGSITGITVNLLTSSSFSAIKLIVDGDSTDITSSRNQGTGILRYNPPLALSSTANIQIYVKDVIGRSLAYSFHHDSIAVVHPQVPDWSKDAVWYQIFPERFRNGDHTNDPIRTSLENPQYDPVSWRVTPWTGDWYARDTWETQKGGDFYSSATDRRYGGDLQGVLDKLDYLDSLGINAIYFNPVFYARSMHKYDGWTMHHIDPYFGPDPQGDIALINAESLDSTSWHWTSADTLFLRLLKEAHKRGMKVILDGVFDHTGVDFPAFHDIVVNQQNSQYTTWYTIYTFDNPNTSQNELSYKGWYGYSSLPEFAQTPDGTNMAPGPKQYVFTITRRWMDPNGDGDPSDGIDGWRLDTVPDVPLGFWADWNTLVQHVNSNAITISEVWSDASTYTSRGGFSGTMNYYYCAIPIYDFITSGRITASAFSADMTNAVSSYGNDVALANQNLVDSHDTERLVSMIINAPVATGFQTINNPRASNSYTVRGPNAAERKVQRMIAFTQMAIVGAPMIYYGDEAGMWGAGDPDDRKPMPWPDLSMSPEATDPRGFTRTADNTNFDSTVYRYYQSAIALRHEHPALRRGDYRQLSVNDGQKTLAFWRSVVSDTVITVINRSDSIRVIDIPLASFPYKSAVNYSVEFSSDGNTGAFGFTVSNNTLHVSVPPVTAGLILPVNPSITSITSLKGWNLVSLPVNVPDHRKSVLFPSAKTPAYYYDSAGYHTTDTMKNTMGYWLRFDSSSTFKLAGPPVDSSSIPLVAGWNLIGSIAIGIDTSSISSTPPGIISSKIYGYDHRYLQVSDLEPGKGYWIKARAPGILNLNLSKNKPRAGK